MTVAAIRSASRGAVGDRLRLDHAGLAYQDSQQVLTVTGWHANGLPFASDGAVRRSSGGARRRVYRGGVSKRMMSFRWAQVHVRQQPQLLRREIPVQGLVAELDEDPMQGTSSGLNHLRIVVVADLQVNRHLEPDRPASDVERDADLRIRPSVPGGFDPSHFDLELAHRFASLAAVDPTP